MMEKILYDAAVENNVSTLLQLLREDPFILDKASLNCQYMNPLHVAAMLGNVEFVRELLRVSPDMCLAADRFGRIPLHLAVIKGRLSVLEELIKARPQAAREKAEGGGNVLHLCVKYDQLEAMKSVVETVIDKDVIRNKDIANRKDDDGMNILHLAICYNQTETIKYLLQKNIVDVNAKNAHGNTALDLFLGDINPEIARVLERAGAEGDITLHDGNKWLSEKRETLMVVASLVAQMAFQASVNTTGGVLEDDGDNSKAATVQGNHSAREAGTAYEPDTAYPFFIRINTVAFASSLSVILLLMSGLPFRHRFFLWALRLSMWLTITSIALTYGISIFLLTPEQHGKQVSRVTKHDIMVWCCVMSLFLLGNAIRLMHKWLKRHYGINVLKILKRWKSAFGKKSHDKEVSVHVQC